MASGREFLSDSQRDRLATLEVMKANTPRLMTGKEKTELKAFYRVMAYLSVVNTNVSIKAYRKFKKASCGV